MIQDAVVLDIRKCLPQAAASVLDTWAYSTKNDRRAIVIPDGCRDLIVERQNHGDTRCSVTELSCRTHTVSVGAGAHMIGLRLRPGTRVNNRAMLEWASNSRPNEILSSDRIDEFCEHPVAVTEALECLQSGVFSVSQAARYLGVSNRTLQRTVKRLTGATPYFWLALARVRRACRSLSEFERLADAAAAFGFADQAHMTREVRTWFGVTPSVIKPGTEVFTQLGESGYG